MGWEGDKFWLNLCRFLERQITFDQLAVFSYEWSDAPKRIFDLHPSPKRDHLHNDLLSAAYLIGPYYNNLVKIQVDDGFYHIDEIAPDAFRDSEYYRIYYSEKHAADEGMFYVRLGSGLSIGLLMERSKPSPAFTDEEMKSLRSVASLVGALARRRWKLVDAPAHRDSDMGEQMVTALECFGSDLLSNRERQIAELMLKGHSSKSGARVLGISPETERVHRKRLYNKLAISSQAELFWMFIQSVPHFRPDRRNDPLRAMLDARNGNRTSTPT